MLAVPRKYIHFIIQITCNPKVLKTALSALNNMRGDRININNQSLRYAGYRQFTWWIYNRLGNGVRKIIPSCAIWEIRNHYPELDRQYAPSKRLKMKSMCEHSCHQRYALFFRKINEVISIFLLTLSFIMLAVFFLLKGIASSKLSVLLI